MILFYLGLDLGQKRDPAALAVIEKRGEILVRHLERMPLGTTYTNIVERVRHIVGHHPLSGHCALAVDGTGLGAPVVDMLRSARLGCEISAVTITSGDKEHRSGDSWNVPKRDLIAGVHLLLEQGGMKISSRLRETGAIVRELMDVRSTSRGPGNPRIGADGYGQHDDLVIALALACWRAKRNDNGFRSAPLF